MFHLYSLKIYIKFDKNRGKPLLKDIKISSVENRPYQVIKKAYSHVRKMHMMFYEIVYFSCKNIFRVYEGSGKYKELKRNRRGNIVVMSVATKYN